MTILTKDQIKYCFKVIRSPSSTLKQILDAKEQLHGSIFKMICRIAQTYNPATTLVLQELIAAGNYGFMLAVEKYDIKKGNFPSYAWSWIFKYVYRRQMGLGNNITSSDFKKVVSVCSLNSDIASEVISTFLDPNIEVEEECIKSETMSRIKLAMNELSEKQKIALRFYFGAAGKERKEILKKYKWKSSNSVLWHKRKAIKELRKKLEIKGDRKCY